MHEGKEEWGGGVVGAVFGGAVPAGAGAKEDTHTHTTYVCPPPTYGYHVCVCLFPLEELLAR